MDEGIDSSPACPKSAAAHGWRPPLEGLPALLLEFLELFDKRPVRDNEGGVGSVGAFTLWYFLKRQRPALVVESGVWKGQTTWLIEQALPGVRMICFDPNREVRQYRAATAEYPRGDFLGYDFHDLDADTAFVFFDDHRDAARRTMQARRKGFEHLVFDDNYPVGTGGHRSLEHALSCSNSVARYLACVIEDYQMFPPLFAPDSMPAGAQARSRFPALELQDSPSWRIFKEQMPSYRWMTYVRLRKNPRLSLAMKALEWIR